MPGFTSRDDIISELTVNGKYDTYNFYKIMPQAGVVDLWHSMWKGVGAPGAGSDPAVATGGTTYNSNASSPVAGSIWFPDRSTDVRQLFSLGATCTCDATIILYDRLFGSSGFALGSTGVKTETTGTVPRYATTAAVANEVWLELTSATSTTAAVFNLSSYTAADGTSALVGPSITVPTINPIGCVIKVPLAATNQGVRSVQTMTVGTAASGGNYNMLIVRPLARLVLQKNIWNEVRLAEDMFGMPTILDTATLGIIIQLSVTTTNMSVRGQVTCGYG